MQKRVLILCAALVASSVAHCAKPQVLTKAQLENAFKEAFLDYGNVQNKFKPKFDRLDDQKQKEIQAIEKKYSLKYDQVQQEISQFIAEENTKKYGLKKDIASHSDIPFSVPLIKELCIAASEHNKEKLRNLLSDYFTIMVGSDWRKFLRETDDQSKAKVVDRTKIIEIIEEADPYIRTEQGSYSIRLLQFLAELYFSVKTPDSIEEGIALENKLIRELFEIAK